MIENFSKKRVKWYKNEGYWEATFQAPPPPRGGGGGITHLEKFTNF